MSYHQDSDPHHHHHHHQELSNSDLVILIEDVCGKITKELIMNISQSVEVVQIVTNSQKDIRPFVLWTVETLIAERLITAAALVEYATRKNCDETITYTLDLCEYLNSSKWKDKINDLVEELKRTQQKS